MKYIIKNCPACILDPSCCAQWHINNGNAKDCSDITDCVMKRIMATCKQEISISSKDAPTNAYAMGRVVVADKILEQLEIEGVDD